MTEQDAETIIALAAVAAMADGRHDASELSAIEEAARRFGVSSADRVIQQAATGQLQAADLAQRLSDDEARQTAYDVALAICNANGPSSSQEDDFLRRLATSLALDATIASAAASRAKAEASSIASSPFSAPPPPLGAVTGTVTDSTGANFSALDDHILDQAILTAALELLPDRLANIGILPLQMRLVRHVGQQHGQQMDANQIKDLVATFGLGAAAQVMESVVRKAFGGIAGGLLGGLLGGAAGTAAGGAVTFASTYALGHAAEQYYAQGRSLSTGDMKALFARFQKEAQTIYPKVQERITQRARGTNLSSLMRSITG